MYRALKLAYEDTSVHDRYVFFDGWPSDATGDEIEEILKQHQNDYMTFVSCTNQTEEVEWIKSIEKSIKNCAEIDDYQTEKAEVERF